MDEGFGEDLSILGQVQTGFGRLGTHFWGFEANGVIPDIGKPLPFHVRCSLTSAHSLPSSSSSDNGQRHRQWLSNGCSCDYPWY